jgi:hypothetical protein
MQSERIRRQAERFRALASTERDRAALEPDARWRRLIESGALEFDQRAADLEKLADATAPAGPADTA